MKPFDLQEALNGAPINVEGEKCYVLRDVTDLLDSPEETRYLVVFPSNHTVAELWTKDYFEDSSMWEEPELTSEQVLKKAYEDDLLVLCDGNPDLPLKVIAKTKNGEFVVQSDDTAIQPWLANLTMEWVFVKDPAPKSDTITVTLPKPFKPKEGEVYYCIDLRQANGILETNYMDNCLADRLNSDNGQCFLTKSDAQAWLDAMKSALED